MDPRIKDSVVRVVNQVGLGKLARQTRALLSPKFRQERVRNREELQKFESQLAAVRPQIKAKIDATRGVALFISVGSTRYVLQQLPVIAGVLAHGLEPVLILPSSASEQERQLYAACGIARFAYWDDFQENADTLQMLNQLAQCQTQDDVVQLKWRGLAVGKYAVSTLMRRIRSGFIDLSDMDVRKNMEVAFRRCLDHAAASLQLLNKWKPELVVFIDRGYTPEGPLFEACITQDLQPITFNAAHRDNALILKRYDKQYPNVHPASLSKKTWQALKDMDWTDEHWARLYSEIEFCYRSGQWYGEVATQHNTSIVDKNALLQSLQLDPKKKTVLLFPHIFWDATFFWGTDIFRDYEEWFRESVKAAWTNDRVNWIIKVHPANVVKNIRDGSSKEFSELQVLAEFGPIPAHIKVLPAETKISTLSVFAVGDVCLTVRGTVGIEAAAFGLNVITAGTGRYDGLGFTHDFSSRDEYLHCLAHVENLPKPSVQQIESARRYAYGVFIARPLDIQTIPFSYSKTREASLEVDITELAQRNLMGAPDIVEIKKWLDSKDLDLCGSQVTAAPEIAAA